MKTALPLVLLVLPVLGLTAGCSGGTTTEGRPLDISQATLRRAESCEDLTTALREDARSKMNRRIDAEVLAIRTGYTQYGYGTTRNAAADAPVPQAAAPTDSAAGGGAGSSAPAHSDTETQVAGVDEADIVKADGTRLYVLHGQKLLLVDAWPAPNMAIAGSTDIEGEPTEMYVADGKVVVFSHVDGTPIYTAAGITPKPAYSDGYSGYGYGYGGDVAVGAPAIAPGGGYGGGRVFSNALTKVTVLALDGTNAQVTRELYFEGSYLSSRRVGDKVRVVLEGGAHGPTLKYSPDYSNRTGPNGQYVAPTNSEQIAAWEALRGTNEAAIAATTYADWIPQAIKKDGGSVAAAPASCTDFYVPSKGTTEFGMTQVVAFDLATPADAPRASTIVGAVDTVYGDANAMVLAGRAYIDPWTTRRLYGYPSTPGSTPPPIPVATLNYTHLHAFDLTRDPQAPLYAGSGTVPGSIKDQFALDQKDGRVRVTTNEQRSGPARSDGKSNQFSHVFVLDNVQGHLKIVGDAGDIAPGEQLYSTRYIGDKAYVVTWHVTDPLFVVDLANPYALKVLGQLQIPGFSEYMHPLDDTHLLTIGRETDDTGHQHTNGGFWYGLAIQIFDVTNPMQPKLQHKFVYDGGEYATSEATQNHKAFTYFDDRKLLAFPYVRQGYYNGTTSTGPSSTLEVFHADVDGGIVKVGSVDHSALLSTMPNGSYGYCGGYYDGSIRRGVFFENVVYSISYGGIVASDVGALAPPVSSLKLSAPTMQGLSCTPTGL
jgi:hypothetical protein